MYLQFTITALQAKYPDLRIPNDPAEALNYLAAATFISNSTSEHYQKQLASLKTETPVIQNQGPHVLLPREKGN